MTVKLLHIRDVCAMLNYKRRKVYQLIADGYLVAVGTGAGRRIEAPSVDECIARLREDAAWHAKSSNGGAKAKVRTTTTRKQGGTAGASRKADDRTKSQTPIPIGRKLDLKI